MTPQHAALRRITAAAEESRPDREAMVAFVRKAIDELPAISTTIGWHMRKDAAEAAMTDPLNDELYEDDLDPDGDE